MLHFLTLFSLALSLVNGLVVPELEARDTPAPLALDFSVETTIGNETVSEWKSRHGLNKRAYPETIKNSGNAYMLDIYLGSNKQKSNVLLDTGSSDLWVPTTDYNPKTSTSAKDTGHPFEIEYVDQTSAKGDYYTDRLQFSTNSKPVLNSFTFASANGPAPGVFGIGDRDQESTSWQYDNLPWALQKAGITPKASYSLYLGKEYQSGTIIFGGIDTEKYEGTLEKYNIDTSERDLSIDLQTVTVNGQSFTEDKPYDLDSGTSYALVSYDLAVFLYDQFNVQQDGTVSCNQPSNKFITFDFGRTQIKVPYSQSVAKNQDGSCSLVFGYDRGYKVLGDTFLRNAYVYYDLTDQTISIAPVKYTSASNIIAA